ncbi:MAG: hypothetical protein JXB32_11955 [Deltaproteobacteria bacterium]|nr:hypothetical protein [Deltaproteobacteria bacterium]
MGRRLRFRTAGVWWVLLGVLVPRGATADEPSATGAAETEPAATGAAATTVPAAESPDAGAAGAGSGKGLGPLEYAPEPRGGNLGAPRAAIPETRMGMGLHWVMGGESTSGGDVARHDLAWLVVGQLELFEWLEVGLELELLQHHEVYYPQPSPVADEESDEFGFLAPRIKAAFLTGDVITLAAGVGLMLPTAGGRDALPLGIDPGFHFQARPIEMLSINFSLPFVLRFDVPDAGDTVKSFFIDPTVGVAVMPVDFIGGFVDAQLAVWLNPDPGAKHLRLVNLVLGVRSRPLPWMMVELGAIVPVAGDIYDKLADFGLGFRIAATPDLV